MCAAAFPIPERFHVSKMTENQGFKEFSFKIKRTAKFLYASGFVITGWYSTMWKYISIQSEKRGVRPARCTGLFRIFVKRQRFLKSEPMGVKVELIVRFKKIIKLA